MICGGVVTACQDNYIHFTIDCVCMAGNPAVLIVFLLEKYGSWSDF